MLNENIASDTFNYLKLDLKQAFEASAFMVFPCFHSELHSLESGGLIRGETALWS